MQSAKLPGWPSSSLHKRGVLSEFSYFSTKTWYRYPSEVPRWGTLNQYPQHLISFKNLEAQVGQKSLTWIRLIICYIVPWWPSWLLDLIAFSNSESDVVWRVLRLSSWSPSWILEMNDATILNLHVTPIPPIKLGLNLTYCLGGDVVWRISRWRPSWTLEQMDFSNSEFP